MERIALTGLCKIELPSATIRLCDGGRIVWGAETFRGKDATFGTIGSLQPLREGVGDELQPLELTLLPPDTTAAASLVVPTFQGSRVRLWIAEYVVATGAVTGTPELKFDGELDQATLSLENVLELTVIPRAARLFELNIGNSLSPAFHKTIWPGETGHDNATGLGRPVAWGTSAPPATVNNGTDYFGTDFAYF
jgi:hypothetical protein